MLIHLLFILFIIIAATVLWLVPTWYAYRKEKAQQRTAKLLEERNCYIIRKEKEVSEALAQNQLLLSNEKQRRLNELTYNINELQRLYPVPQKKWQNYFVLKREVNQLLFHIFDKLEPYKLSDKEMLFCASCLIYRDMSLSDIATHIFYSAVGIRTLKQRTAQKLGTTAAHLHEYLIEMAIQM